MTGSDAAVLPAGPAGPSGTGRAIFGAATTSDTGRRLLELLGITGLAFAQPVFDLLSRNDSLFVLWDTTPISFVMLAVAIAFGPAVLLLAIETPIGLVDVGLQRWVHRGLVGIIAGLLVVEVCNRYTSLAPVPILLAGVAGSVGLAAVMRFDPVRLWLRFLAVAPLLFALLFVFASGATPVAFGGDPPFATARPEAPARVVMVVLDELPLSSLLDDSGAIDAAAYPNLAALSRQGTWYRNASTVSAFTETAVPAILTGTIPDDARDLPFVSTYPENLFTLLGAGYDLHVREAVTRLCPSSACPPTDTVVDVHSGWWGMVRDTLSLWREFASPFDGSTDAFVTLGAADLQPLTTAERFIAELAPTAQPRLDFLHVLAPHWPWHYLPTGQDYAAYPAHASGLRGDRWVSQSAADAGRVGHLLQAAAVDRMIGSLVARLRAIGAYDDTLIVVTADHGAAFAQDRPFRGVAADTWPEVMWIPLLIKAPGQTAGGPDDRRAESIDILPTIAAVLELELPWAVDGRSLDAAASSGRDRRRLLDAPEHAMDPMPGEHVLEFDGAEGFAAVLRAAADAPDRDDPLWAYRSGRYGDLLGAPVASFAPANPDDAPTLRATIDRLASYASVVPTSAAFPWATLSGAVTTTAPTETIVVTVNGTIALTTESQPRARRTGTAAFWGVLPPELFVAGANDIGLYTISGPASDPTLRRIDIDAGT